MPTPAAAPIDQLRHEWAVIVRTPAAEEALRRLAAAEPLVAAANARHLGELVDSLHGARDDGGRQRAARTLGAMLRSQAVHPLVPRAILQAIVPGLVGVARRLDWGAGGDASGGGAFFTEVVATAWEVIVAWAGEDRGYAVLDILSAVRCRLRRQILRERDSRSRAVLDPELEARTGHCATTGTTDLDELAGVLGQLAGHGLDRDEAALLFSHRVLGLSIAELAEQAQCSRRRMGLRRDRALLHFCEQLSA